MTLRAIPRPQTTVVLEDEVDVLNFALTNELLQVAFYNEGLNQFDEAAFTDAGFDPQVREFIAQIAANEEGHRDALSEAITALDGEPVEEGEYDFSAAFVDLPTFLGTAQVFENNDVGTLEGAAPLLQENGDLLTAALNIHSVEARQAAYLNGLLGVSPFPAAVDTPRTPDEAFAVIAPFIVATGDEGDGAATPEA